MSLFSSPAFRIFNAENADRTAVKPGGNKLQIRKPLVDRSVNCNTPDAKISGKVAASGKQPQVLQKKCVDSCVSTLGSDLEIDYDLKFSYKEIQQVEDFMPFTKRIEINDVYHIMKNYLGKDSTPPPSPTKFDFQWEPLEINNSICDDSFKSTSSFDSDDISYARELPEYNNIELPPPIDFEDFCM
ncbi:uncharacterized protein LOC126741963 isoform X2 [Anthonomus grandis grandis]|uniref:uncharacterized protein LOC126741963 isoform X2 n=1 Tax=Anthonomus grandis grandis TaxID=2921223 RepID=UPI002165FC24|nr:uncharacterized protein LOC126741963 isoform X2 [Anthonomus grandis grandis]